VEGGHSQRAAAGALDVSRAQVQRDLKQLDPPIQLPERVTGLDGKSRPTATRRTEIRANAHRDRVIRGLSALSGICVGLATIDHALLHEATTDNDLNDWLAVTTDGIKSLRDFKSHLERKAHEA
jgi:hypothetical protein